MLAIDRYVGRLMVTPLASTLILSALLLILDRIGKLLDFVAEQGGAVSIVWRMLANLVPEYLSLGISIGLLLGVLLTFRRLAITSELDVLRAVGVSYIRLLRVPYAAALLLTLANFAILGFVQPHSRFDYEHLRFELRTGALGVGLRVGEFNRLGDKTVFRFDHSRKNENILSGVFLRLDQGVGRYTVANADEGRFFATDDPDHIILQLIRGVIVTARPDYTVPRVLTFTSHSLIFPLPALQGFRQRGADNSRELTLPELYKQGVDPKTPRADKLKSWAEFHFRLVQLAATLIVPLLGMALAVPPKRSSSAVGIFLAIIAIVSYYKVNEYMASLAGLGKLNPILALWIPFMAFAAICIWMFHSLAFGVGDGPIGRLDRIIAKASLRIKHLIKFLRNSGSELKPSHRDRSRGAEESGKRSGGI